MKKFSLAIWIVLLIVCGATLEARACTCELEFPKRTLKQQVKRARAQSRAVFVGQVLEVINVPGSSLVTVKFRVESFWKGKLLGEVSLTTGGGGGDCGYRFAVGQKYLVYAYGSDERNLGTNICQRTAELIDAAADLKLLGKAKVPSQADRAAPSNSHNPFVSRGRTQEQP